MSDLTPLFAPRGGAVLGVSRNPAKRAKLVSQGAQEAKSIGECARSSGIVFSSISDDAALLQIALGPDGHARQGP